MRVANKLSLTERRRMDPGGGSLSRHPPGPLSFPAPERSARDHHRDQRAGSAACGFSLQVACHTSLWGQAADIYLGLYLQTSPCILFFPCYLGLTFILKEHMFYFHCAGVWETDCSLKGNQGTPVTCSFPFLDFQLIYFPEPSWNQEELSFGDGLYFINHHS